MRLILFQPDIPQNLGAAMRLAACFDASLDVVEPCGFALTDRAIKRAAMDYAPSVTRHASWNAFLASRERGEGRLVVFSTKAETAHWDFAFEPSDLLLFGRESAGVPDDVRAAADAAVRIPIRARSLNVAVAAGIGLAEAVRRSARFQTAGEKAPYRP